MAVALAEDAQGEADTPLELDGIITHVVPLVSLPQPRMTIVQHPTDIPRPSVCTAV
jgi:hypothetical protein